MFKALLAAVTAFILLDTAGSKKFILKNSRTFNGSLDDKECIEYLKIAPNTFYKYKKELRAEPQ